MSGTLKSLLAVAGLWVGAGTAWMFILGVSAAASGKGMGTALTLAMVASWASALLLGLAVVAVGKRLAWRWMPTGGGRVGLVVGLAALQTGTLLLEVFSVFVVFNR